MQLVAGERGFAYSSVQDRHLRLYCLSCIEGILLLDKVSASMTRVLHTVLREVLESEDLL
jgi:hypothetical protein